MSESPEPSDKNSYEISTTGSFLKLEDAQGFVSKIPEMPLEVVYRQNLELLPLLLKLTKPSRFDRTPSHEEFVFKP
jgi:hypothetical protein